MARLSFRYVRHEPVPETLLDFLTRRFRYHDAAEWEALVHDGHVTVDGREVSPQHLLETRQRIVYERPPQPEPPVDPAHSVLFEDAHLLAVSKSGNIPTSPSGKYWDNCLTHLLQRTYGLESLHPVHRLDRETSGVNLFAKTREAARRLNKDFQHGRVHKVYAAVLRGRLPVLEAWVNAPVRAAANSQVRIRQEVHGEGRPCRTRFTVQAVLPGATLAAVRPLTGRTHQIRVHAAHLGHPVWGDRLYGGSEEAFLAWLQTEERSSANRQLLHASELTFTHPVTHQALTLQDPPAALLRLFEGESTT